MRLFIATSFPVAILRDLNDRVAAVKPKLGVASWVRPETQHLTFAFLGEQDESMVTKLSEMALTAPPFEARLRGAGFFPNPRRARVGWIGLAPEEPFVRLASEIRHFVKSDDTTFKPHLTLMRIRDPWPPACVETFQRTFTGYESERFVVDRVTLYSSKLSPKGALHTPLAHFTLSECGGLPPL
jgi:RNA 2',3'-cyclic 3'-phosphodiesterase